MKLEPHSLLAEARTQAGGLSDFGDPSFHAGLEALCAALNFQAQLSATGAAIFRQKLVTQLANRLHVEDWFARHPEIANEPIEAPLVIVGLPRTGTTKLHRLLSRDPRFSWMNFWESQFPVPFPGESLQDPAPRIDAARQMVDLMTTAMPRLAAMHPMYAEEADEEVMLMEHSFMSAFNAYAHVPSYDAWLDAQDQTPAYAYLRRMMQFLQWQQRRRGKTPGRWVLKAPHHLLRMHLLHQQFPGAQVILTHRDPVSSIPSIASFIHTLWCIYSDAADPKAAGAQWNALMRRALQHTMQVRQTAPAQFLDVNFRDTVQQPLHAVQRIYDFIGWTQDATARTRMESWLVADANAHQGGHDYKAETFGLSEVQIRQDFADYIARHLTA